MIIYKITNLINNKVYVGQTVNTLESRIKTHFSKHSNCTALKQAIMKYKEENFVCEIIDKAETLEELNYKEEYYIDHYDCIVPRGYNLKGGGYNKTLSEETKEKISKAQLGAKNHMFQRKGDKHPRFGVKHTKLSRKKMSESSKGQIPYMKGKFHKEESKQKMRKAKLGKPLSDEHKKALKKSNKSYLQRKKIYCVELDKEFISIKEAARILNLPDSNIIKVLKQQRKTCGGYTFIYAEEKSNGI